MWRAKIKRRRKREFPPPGVGWVLHCKPLEGNSSACPARQACISLAVRDCHRERDSPPEGLSFGFSNIGSSGCQSKKNDTSALSGLCGRINAIHQSPGSPRFVLASDVGPNEFCGRQARSRENLISLVLHLCRIDFSPAQQKCSKPRYEASGNYYRLPNQSCCKNEMGCCSKRGQ